MSSLFFAIILSMNWLSAPSDHYIFHYHPESVAARDIDKIIRNQEKHYEVIASTLSVDLNEKIRYFLCNSSEEVGRAYGDGVPINAFARMPNIFAVYTEKVKSIGPHEDTHLIASKIGNPEQKLLREGLAMFFDESYWKIPNQTWSRVFKDNGVYPNITELCDNDRFDQIDTTITYPFSGYFVKCLVDEFGISKFKEFYATVGKKFSENFEKEYKAALPEFERVMLNTLTKATNSGSEYEECVSHLRSLNII